MARLLADSGFPIPQHLKHKANKKKSVSTQSTALPTPAIAENSSSIQSSGTNTPHVYNSVGSSNPAHNMQLSGKSNRKISWADMCSDEYDDDWGGLQCVPILASASSDCAHNAHVFSTIEQIPQQGWATKVACKLIGDQANAKIKASGQSSRAMSWADMCSDEEDDFYESPWLAAPRKLCLEEALSPDQSSSTSPAQAGSSGSTLALTFKPAVSLANGGNHSKSRSDQECVALKVSTEVKLSDPVSSLISGLLEATAYD